MIPNQNGPYLSAALFCEKVLRERDGVVSIIRMIERVTITLSDAEYPKESGMLPKADLSVNALIAFKAGEVRGMRTVRWSMKTPSGETLLEKLLPISFEGEDHEPKLILELNLAVNQEGIYWADVLLEDQLVTRMPLHVVYLRMGYQN